MKPVPLGDAELFLVLKRVLPLATTLLFTFSFSVGQGLALSQPSQVEDVGQGIKDSAVELVKGIVRGAIDIASAVATPMAMIGSMMYFSGFMRYEGGRIMMAAIVSLFLGQAFLPMI